MGYLNYFQKQRLTNTRRFFMKNIFKKSMGVVLVLLISLSSFSGCINNLVFHAHNYKLQSNETEHFKECSCGEIKDSAKHTFDWIIDSEPTYTAPGYKYEECADCGYRTGDSIVTDRLVHEDEMTKEGCIFPTKSVKETKTCYGCSEFVDFYEKNKNEIKDEFLCFNATSNEEDGIYILDEIVQLRGALYQFAYEGDESNNYLNSYITVSFKMYSSELGSHTDGSDYVGTAASIAFRMNFYKTVENINSCEFVFHKYYDTDSIYDNIIKIYFNSICVGEIFYLTDSTVYVSKEWIVDYLKEYLFVL